MATILVVDDSEVDRTVYGGMLQRHGYETIFAVDGAGSIQTAIDRKPDMILMDIIMPGVNGYKAMREISRNPETKNIPIVVMSTKNDETDIVYGKRQGAIDYLVKPVSEDDLISAVTVALSV